MIWLRCEDLAIERLGFGQPSCLVALQRKVEGFWDRHSLNLRHSPSHARVFVISQPPRPRLASKLRFAHREAIYKVGGGLYDPQFLFCGAIFEDAGQEAHDPQIIGRQGSGNSDAEKIANR
jgi:hypothetical protein